jgi:cytochrome c556
VAARKMRGATFKLAAGETCKSCHDDFRKKH